uniref:Uncharacterized protein n=1 Tax=Cyanothece sp. (strain PCC 7425 / ATCC 29141) TaxID=395961 RepID=B8HZ04_CYAP4
MDQVKRCHGTRFPCFPALLALTFTISIVAPAVPSSAASDQQAPLTQNIEAGLQQALQEGRIKEQSALHLAVKALLSQLAQGASLETAAQASGLFVEVASQLAQQGKALLPMSAGKSQPVNSKIQQKNKPFQQAVLTQLPAQKGQVMGKPSANAHTLANALVRGLAVANRTGEIGYRDDLSFQVQNVVRYLRRGNTLERAVQSTRISRQTVDRLLVLGGYRAGQ